MFPSQDPEYLKKIAKLHAWPGQAFEELYDNLDFEELDETEPRTDWLIKDTSNLKGTKRGKRKETKDSKS